MKAGCASIVGTLAAMLLAAFPAPAHAQLDPLRFLKTTKPNVIIAFDTRADMLRDANDDYYDGFTYTRTGSEWEAALGPGTSTGSGTGYRRKYVRLRRVDPSTTGVAFTAESIQAVGESADGYLTFWSRTRFEVARIGLRAAVDANRDVVRFGLVRMRQSSPAWGRSDHQEFVTIPPSNASQQSPTETGSNGVWLITPPSVQSPNGSMTGVQAPLVPADALTASREVLTILDGEPGADAGLIPAGRDSASDIDAPIAYMLGDARVEAERLMAGEVACRNTVLVLVVGGGEGTTAQSENPAAMAGQFLNVSGHRVPIYVVAIAPPAAAVAQLQSIAAASGGRFFEITAAMIEAVAPGGAVPEVTRAVNLAVQHAFASPGDVDALPTSALPAGPFTEFQAASPVIGTVNLEGARDILGVALVDTRVRAPSGALVPQRSNLLVTTALAMPGFEARLRAFRVYHPVADATQESGYAFVSDGSRLWVASTPSPAVRNIFTVLPGAAGLIPFTTDNATVLSPFLNVADPERLIEDVRALPLGAPISSTPAVMGPPSLDPPPDIAYSAFASANADRRGLVWIGTNDGMLHAIDARLGVEIWAFIPANLLPKLRALRDGQPVGQFDYFVDASPRIADVKIGADWRTVLVVGEGRGGTFYQTLDVTMDGVSRCVSAESDAAAAVLQCFADASRIRFRWSFPDYAHFDYASQPYGELDAARASNAEKTVGQTWSVPAVGQIQDGRGKFVVIAGSGFLPYSTQQARGGLPAGNSLYLLDAGDGTVYDSRSVGSDHAGETIDDCAVAGDCSILKNAVQANPATTGPPDLPYVSGVYVGDLDGRVWRFDFGSSPSTDNPVIKTDPIRIFEGAPANPVFSSVATAQIDSVEHLVFFGTGSDRLPSVGVSNRYRLVGVLDAGAIATPKFAELLASTDGTGEDEQMSGAPTVAGDVVFYSTTRTRPQEPCMAPEGLLHGITFAGGPAYDTNGDGVIAAADTTTVRTVSAAPATAPFVADRHVLMSAGDHVEILGDPRGYNSGIGRARLRVLSWREARE